MASAGITNVPYDLGKLVKHTDLKEGEEYYYTDRPLPGEISKYRKVIILDINKVREGYFKPKLLFLDTNEVVNYFGIGPEMDKDFTGDGNTFHRFHETKQKEYYQEGLGNLVNAGKTPPTTASKIGKFLGLDGGLRRSRRNKTRRGGRKSKRRLSKRR